MTSAPDELISRKSDPHGGIRIDAADPHNLQLDCAEKVDKALGKSLIGWREDGVRGVWCQSRTLVRDWPWIETGSAQAHWVPAAVKHGFDYHNAQGTHLTLTKWLPDTAKDPCTIPKAPFTSIGSGGLVISTDGMVLLMRERRGAYLGWKFPGGLVDPGESIYSAAQREVLEETGVNCKVECTLCIRHWHDSDRHQCVNCAQLRQAGCSGDMYFVCLMTPANGGGAASHNEPRCCPQETAACRWFSRSEIDQLSSELIRPFHHSILKLYDEHVQRAAGAGAKISCATVREPKREFELFCVK